MQGKDPRNMTVLELNSLGHYKKSMLKIIKEMCNSCVGADPNTQRNVKVKRCQVFGCPLWPYRTGKNPFSTRGEISEKQKDNVKKRFAKARENK